jgi:hypothetical protein
MAKGTFAFDRHPGIAQCYPGGSACAFQPAIRALDSGLRGNGEVMG